MSLRALFVVTAFGSFGSLVACGGRAFSPDLVAVTCEYGVDCADELPEPEPPETPEPELLPETVTILELLEIGDVSASQAQIDDCDLYQYRSRIKVNLEERLLMLNWCSTDESGSMDALYGSNFILTDADVATIESAYADLQLSAAEQCTSGPEIITLDVSTDTHPEPERLLADDDHSGCALPLLEQRDFVTGLDELRSVLLSFATR
jgi:hypothetical protein